jgi:hypothetical protein
MSLHLLADRVLGLHVGSTAPVFLAVLVVHIGSGTGGVVNGIIAALARKGGPRHVHAGRRYYLAITVLSVTSVALAIMRWPEDAYLLVIALIMFTAATIGARPRWRGRPGGPRHIVAMNLSFVAMMTGFYVDNGPHLPLLDDLPVVVFWLIPALAGVTLTAWSIRRAARMEAQAAGHNETREGKETGRLCVLPGRVLVGGHERGRHGHVPDAGHF